MYGIPDVPGTIEPTCYFLRGFLGAAFAGFGVVRGSGGVLSKFRSKSSVLRLATSGGNKSSDSKSLAGDRANDSAWLAGVCALRLVMVGACRG